MLRLTFAPLTLQTKQFFWNLSERDVRFVKRGCVLSTHSGHGVENKLLREDVAYRPVPVIQVSR